MDSIRKAVFISLNNFKKWPANPRVYVIFLLLLGYINMIFSSISAFCEKSGYKIALWVFPFLLAEPYSRLMILLGLILLFCDAPFIEAEQPYIITRAGRKLWTIGQIIYIILASALYFLTVLILTFMLLVPFSTLESGWGKVINTLSQFGAGRYSVALPFDLSIVNTFSPMEAMLLELLLCWLLGIFVGLVMFILNLQFSRSAGGVAAAAISMFPLFVRKTDWSLHYISPASWASLSVLDFSHTSSFPSFEYALISFAFLIAVAAFTAIILMKNKNIDVLKSV